MDSGRNSLLSDAAVNERRQAIFYAKTDEIADLDRIREFKEKVSGLTPAEVAEFFNEPIVSMNYVPNAGTFHALFQIATGKKRYYLKIGLPEAAETFSIELWAMRQLSNRGLPWLNGFACSDKERANLVIDEAPGKPLNRFENPETQATPEPLLYEFGALLARVHQVSGSGAGLLEFPLTSEPKGLHKVWNDYIRLRLDEHLRECLKIQAITGMELSAIESHFNEADDLLASAPMRLLHGDPGHHNVFSDGQKITAIIDWEDALVGDPIFDVAFWGTFVRDEMRERFLEGYSTITPLPSDFERRYWLYYLRVAISKTVHRHKFGAKDRPGRPPASQRIQKALSKLAEL